MERIRRFPDLKSPIFYSGLLKRAMKELIKIQNSSNINSGNKRDWTLHSTIRKILREKGFLQMPGTFDGCWKSYYSKKGFMPQPSEDQICEAALCGLMDYGDKVFAQKSLFGCYLGDIPNPKDVWGSTAERLSRLLKVRRISKKQKASTTNQVQLDFGFPKPAKKKKSSKKNRVQPEFHSLKSYF